jgi:hypothetical protein
MTSIQKPKRALLAYCALADRLQRPNAGLMEALMPFFGPVCRDLAGKMFDAAQFSEEIHNRYGLRIPRLAVLGLAEQLGRDGLLESVLGYATKEVYRYPRVQTVPTEDVPSVTEEEIDRVLAEFVTTCRSDELLISLDVEALHAGFLDRLLNTESMRLLSRKESNSGTKRTDAKLTRKAVVPNSAEHRELRLDFHVAQFLLDLKQVKPELFDRVSDIAFANMAAEALACFREAPSAVASLSDFSVYFDSPLLLDILGVNSEYEDYGAELLEMVKAADAKPKVFDDAVAEAESVIAARLVSARSGRTQLVHLWGAVSPYVLNALARQVGAQAAQKGIEVKADPKLDLLRSSRETYGSIQVSMDKQMAAWQNQDARTHDQRSVWSMLRIRDVTTLRTKIREGQAIFVARNPVLVRIANEAWRTWLREAINHTRDTAERWAPIAMSDKQLAGYLWLRNSGAGNGTMSRARLLAHCSAAIRPRQDVKNRAYSLVLELHGKQQADIVSALLEDRDGERALMRATRADPEDVTQERLSYIIDQVKLGAGEFAAAHAREEGRIAAEAKQAEHDAQVARLQQAAADEAARTNAQTGELAQGLAQETLQRVQAEVQAKAAREELEHTRRQRLKAAENKFCQAFDDASIAYKRSRWEVFFLYGALLLYGLVSTEGTAQIALLFVLTMAGFWYFPKYFDTTLQKHALWFMKQELKRLDVADMLPSTENPDFENSSWAKKRFEAVSRETEAAKLSNLVEEATDKETVAITS